MGVAGEVAGGADGDDSDPVEVGGRAAAVAAALEQRDSTCEAARVL